MRNTVKFVEIGILAATLYCCMPAKRIQEIKDSNPIKIEQEMIMDTVEIQRYPGDIYPYKLIAPKDSIDGYKRKIEDAFRKIYQKKNFPISPDYKDNILFPIELIYKQNIA